MFSDFTLITPPNTVANLGTQIHLLMLESLRLQAMCSQLIIASYKKIYAKRLKSVSLANKEKTKI